MGPRGPYRRMRECRRIQRETDKGGWCKRAVGGGCIGPRPARTTASAEVGRLASRPDHVSGPARNRGPDTLIRPDPFRRRYQVRESELPSHSTAHVSAGLSPQNRFTTVLYMLPMAGPRRTRITSTMTATKTIMSAYSSSPCPRPGGRWNNIKNSISMKNNQWRYDTLFLSGCP